MVRAASAVKQKVGTLLPFLEALGLSTLVVTVAEIGDKTQLLAIVLAARFRAPWLVLAGILAATLVNHALAAVVGAAAAELLGGAWFRWAVGLGFLLMAGWALVPDQGATEVKSRGSVFWTSTFAFFLVEMGDKTQVATALLAAKHQQVISVTLGTTLGMMLANAPAVWLGERITRLVPLRWVRVGAAALFAALGLLVLPFGLALEGASAS
ncbi:TMEM165/GDT1 family protein [Thermaurantiacus sp.]